MIKIIDQMNDVIQIFKSIIVKPVSAKTSTGTDYQYIFRPGSSNDAIGQPLLALISFKSFEAIQHTRKCFKKGLKLQISRLCLLP